MKQRSKLLCALMCLALCLCMVLVAVPATKAFAACEHVDANKADGRCDTCGSLAQDVYLAYTTASLEDKISVNYFLLLSDAVANDPNAYIQFTMADGEVIQIPATQSKLIDGYDVFTCQVAAKEMTDIITMQFYYNGQPVFAEAHRYNVRAYAKHIMENYQDAKTLDLMEKMVNYGAAAQIHFGYKANDLANSFLANKPDYSNVTITGFDGIRGQGTQKVKLYSASLLLTSETTLRLFFNGKVSVTLDGKPLKVSTRSGLYYADIVGIAAKELDDDVTVVINDGTETASITYNPMTYCQAIQNSAAGTYTDEMQNLVRALYLYNQSADDYFAGHVTQGTNMVNALHYLNGDPANTKITSQVQTVTFGLSRDYRDIAASYPATLVSEEQDTPVYAYYVSNNGKYDLYFLSNDDIYLPEYSYNLFYHTDTKTAMSSLTSVNTENLNTSRAVDMGRMFRNCAALVDVDVSKFDTSSATNINGMFYQCYSIPSLNVSNWDVSNVTDMAHTFRECSVLTKIEGLSNWNTGKVTTMQNMFYRSAALKDVGDLTNWDVSNVTSMHSMFNGCTSLTTVKADNWNTGKVTTMQNMFLLCENLKTVKAKNWKVGNVENWANTFDGCASLTTLDVSNWDFSGSPNVAPGFYATFQGCTSLTKLDVSKWDLKNITSMNFMFSGCTSLQELDVSGWNVSNVREMNYVFRDCAALQELDVSNWVTSSAVTMKYLFAGCTSLQSLATGNWDTSNVTNMDSMFYRDYNLEYVNVTNWDVSKVTNMEHLFASDNQNDSDMKLKNVDVSKWKPENVTTMGAMFYGCGALTELNMQNWNMPKLTTVSHMFADCINLETINVSGWQTPALTCLDGTFNHCKKVKELDMSSFDTSDVTVFAQTFEHCYALERIYGLENWNTAKGNDFSEMFSTCSSLKELNLSSFDTRNAYSNPYTYPGTDNWGFLRFMENCSSLERVIFGANFSFDGNGNCPAGYRFIMPSATAAKGWTGVWYDENGKAYLPSEIREEIAHTYVSHYTPKGATMKDALTYLNADSASTGITTKVTSITFGLTKDHEEITGKYIGVLADQEQDGPVYAYYVPNGNNFDVYFLSDDTIYLPASSKRLCNGMSALQTVRGNVNTSRVTSMYEMFYNCPKLQSVDCVNWDVSQVTTMCAMFENCTSLTDLNTANWNTGNVKNMSYMFHNCPSVTTLDVSGWNTAKVTNMYAMFAQCSKVTTLDVSGWDTSNVTNVKTMFKDCSALKSVVGSGQMNLNKATDLYCMFENCGVLEYLDVTNWGLENVTSMTNTFFKCYKLTTLEGCENWNLSNVTSMIQTFCYCHALTDLDVSTWDTSNCTDMSCLFKGCRSLTTLAVDDWDVSNVKTFASMFSGDGSNAADMNLTHLNLSKWNMSSAQDTNRMFYGCAQMTALDLSGWDVRQLQDMNHMFADCHKLATINFTGWQTDSLTNMDATFNHCKALESVDLSMFNTSKVTKMCQMFEECESLEEIIGLDKFNTAKVTDFSEMFTSTKLTTLDLSSFDTSSAKVIYSMFKDNQLLKTIYVGDGWNMNSATSYNDLFSNCSNLVGGNGTTYAGSDLKYACVDTQETPGYLTYKAAKNENP